VIIRSLKFVRAALEPSGFPKTSWAEVAVAGRSNVGKSSLLNTLFERKNLARISKAPGKTRSINFYAVNERFHLVDLPGYGYAKVSVEMRRAWMRAIHAYVAGRPALAGVVQLIDARHPPTEDDMAMLARLVESGRPFIVVFTKADKIARSERRRVAHDFNDALAGLSAHARALDGAGSKAAAGKTAKAVDIEALFFSARTGEGRDELWSWILARIEGARGAKES